MAAEHQTDTESKKFRKTGKRLGVRTAVVVVCAVGILVTAGVGVAMAAREPQLAFGLGTRTTALSATVATLAVPESNDSAEAKTDLTQPVTHDVSAAVNAINEREEAERRAIEEARRAAEEALRAEEAETLAAVNEKIATQRAGSGIPTMEEVNWAQGKEAFIAEWTNRIDSYLAGSPLAGQGVTFATAAWYNRVDPRWSPAISTTESTKGLNCSRYHNAWGWGTSSWATWEDAIYSHVQGLGDRYGYTINRYYAKIYCPPTWENWYDVTLSEMKKI